MALRAPPAERPRHQKARIFVVDDHPLVRRGLHSLINREPGFCVCGEARGADAAVPRILKTRPAIAIVDLTISSEMDGLELIRQLRARRPELKILVFSLHQEKFYQKQAAAAGADAFVGKDQGPARVVAALRDLLRHAPGIAQIGSTASGHSPGTYASR